MGRVVAAVAGWARHLQTTHAGRAWGHYNAERGPVLAGGMAYVALFSVSSVLFVGFTVVGTVVGQHFALRAQVIQAINGQVPGLIATPGSPDALLQPGQLFGRSLLSAGGAVAAVLALLAGLGWVDALREGVRAMCTMPKDRLDPLAQRLHDAVGLVTFGLAVLASAVLSVVVNATAGSLLEAVGLEGSLAGRVLLRVLGTGVVLLVDAGTFVVLLRVLAHLPVPGRDLRQAALVGAAAIGVLKLSAGVLLPQLTSGRNPIYATAGVLVGVLLWMNLVSRVVLLTAAWAATDPRVAAALTAAEGERIVGPPVGPAAVGAAARPYARPTYGARAGDRVALAAGAVLGAAALAGVRALAATARSLAGLARSAGRDR